MNKDHRMYLRKLWLIIAVPAVMVLGAMASPLAFGLGLGEISLNSNLNQPLDAEIKLLQVRDLSREEILVQLGSVEDFRRRGIERIFFLQDIRFDVQLNSPNGPVLKLTSQKPVVEPFLIFIIQLEWPSGRAQREYTLLLDLPVFTERPAQPIQRPQTQPVPTPATPPVQQAQPRPQTPPPSQPPRSTAATPPPPLPTRPDVAQPVRPQPQPSAPRPSTPPEPLSPSLQTGDTYNVVANDTLWEIALRTRPNRGVSVQQTMLALQRLNPDAFINNNINLLKEGQVLRIPSDAEIQQLDQRSAVNEVAYQNTRWSGNPDGLVSGAELQGSRTVTRDTSDDDARRGQLTLASPTDTTRATGGRSGSGLSAGERDALQNELAITLEQLDSSQRESAELNERVQELEAQIATMERLIDVSNEEMRTLQLALQQNAQNPGDVVEPPADDRAVEDNVVEDNVVEDPSSTEVEPANVPSATPVPQPAPVAPVVPVQPKPGIMDMLMNYIWSIGIGVIVILLGAFYMWHRKTQADMASFDDFDDDGFDDQDQMDFDNNDFQEESGNQDDFDLAMDEDVADFDEAPVEDQVAPTEAETGDAVGEADIYIAYGKYDQAEEMLRRAIINEPDNVEARVKLLEVYSETANGTKFDGEYGKLLALGDVSANARAAELRGNIPGIGQYQSPADSTIDRSFAKKPTREDNELELSLDLADDRTAESEAVESDETGFDFDLDDSSEDGFGELDLDEGNLSPPAAKVQPAAETEEDDDLGSIDFNLDLDDDAELALDTEEDQELTLDLDGDNEIDENLTLKIEDDDEELALDLEDDDDLSFDLDADEAEFDKEFESVLEEDPLPDPAVNETVSRDFDFEPAAKPKTKPKAKDQDDILSDLEFSAAALASEQDKDDNLARSAKQLDLDATELSGDDDDFDLEMGDVDLAALDEEMDALVGDLDDVDDDDVAVSPTEVVPALSEAEIEEAGFDFDADIEFESDEPHTATSAAVNDDETGLDEDSELDFLADTDEVATKLDLARAYIDMGDKDGAKDILSEVVSEGNDEQRQEAKTLLGKIG
jgi:pilus assembly protein FimV